MDEAVGRPLKLMLEPHAVSLGLSLLFFLAMSFNGFARYEIMITIAYYVLLNLAVKSQPISIDLGQNISDSFLSSFANNLATLAPEQAFSEALKGAHSPQLRQALAKMRNGIPLTQALLSLEVRSNSEITLLIAISNTLSYGSTEASDRLRKYLAYRQERKRIVTDYQGKMAVLSLRLKVLSVIAAASLAVIAFASPLLGSLSLGAEMQLGHSIGWSMPTFAFFSASILSPFLFSKTVPNTSGRRIAAICGLLFLSVFVLLRMTIGWQF
jgi:hypothetical protein